MTFGSRKIKCSNCGCFHLLWKKYSHISFSLSFSFDVWKALANAFGSISQNRQLQIHIELLELKKNDLSIFQYLQKAKALTNELAIAGRPLSSAEFNAIVIAILVLNFIALLLHLIWDLILFLLMNFMANWWLMKFYCKALMKFLLPNMVVKQSSTWPLLPTPITTGGPHSSFYCSNTCS